MARQSTLRPLADHPFTPVSLWCLKCLRTSVKNYDPSEGKNFATGCVFDAASSVKWLRECWETVSILPQSSEWADFFFAEESEEIWDLFLRSVVGCAAAALAGKFADAEKAHRVEHQTSAATKKAMAKFQKYCRPGRVLAN
ncbi:uncharacterized protein BP01DRAFT_386746 [Aspergillus saccharolyticus JOP 1030-1]|uniref:Uncharacterized protein n=1 Tax=Aspergillus saccharolyticus JOP 1030-1 TaxID=1450539 RepID=A0A318Z1Y4_9EURO|nr:hypothetical protein BP01DRAFT_386746 [Aspergillus saccharolyticus JOP 1030-1]PYH41056.1 hypothetical protein BP01DRAFT_386746 [Aspergillus saccharolyticus JOP 1030-1]